MSATYELRIYSPDLNVLLLTLHDWLSLEYGRLINDVGVLVLRLSFENYRILKGQKDARIEVWRKVEGTGNYYLDGETQYFVRKIVRRLTDDGKLEIEITAFDSVTVLARRSVLFQANTSQASKTAPADNMIKTIWSEQITRNPFLGNGIVIQGQFGLAPSITKAFAWRNCLDIFKEIADASATAGTYLAYDVFCFPAAALLGTSNLNLLVLRTYIGQRGINRSVLTYQNNNNNGFFIDINNLASIEVTEDWTDEVSNVTAGGPGQDTDRLVQAASDTTRYSANGGVEKFVDARMANDAAGTLAEANQSLRDFKRKLTHFGKITDTDLKKFGRDYNYGDIITIRFFEDSIDVRINAYKIKVDSGGEDVQVNFEAVNVA